MKKISIFVLGLCLFVAPVYAGEDDTEKEALAAALKLVASSLGTMTPTQLLALSQGVNTEMMQRVMGGGAQAVVATAEGEPLQLFCDDHLGQFRQEFQGAVDAFRDGEEKPQALTKIAKCLQKWMGLDASSLGSFRVTSESRCRFTYSGARNFYSDHEYFNKNYGIRISDDMDEIFRCAEACFGRQFQANKCEIYLKHGIKGLQKMRVYGTVSDEKVENLLVFLNAQKDSLTELDVKDLHGEYCVNERFIVHLRTLPNLKSLKVGKNMVKVTQERLPAIEVSSS